MDSRYRYSIITYRYNCKQDCRMQTPRINTYRFIKKLQDPGINTFPRKKRNHYDYSTICFWFSSNQGGKIGYLTYSRVSTIFLSKLFWLFNPLLGIDLLYIHDESIMQSLANSPIQCICGFIESALSERTCWSKAERCSVQRWIAVIFVYDLHYSSW